jgi:hypothetical protein
MINCEGMRITIDCKDSYDGIDYHWKVISDGTAGFYQSGRSSSYRSACRDAKRAMKKLAGIGWLPYEENIV